MTEQINISKRLQLLASFVHHDSFFADIGTDHAYLPCFVCLQHPKVKAIAGEVNKGPFEHAQETVLQYNLVNRIDVRLGSGLDVIHDHDAIDTLTIAGMGGALITSILSADVAKLQQVPKIIAQPNNYAQSVRRFLYEQQYDILDEHILEEKDHIYEIIIGEKTKILKETSDNEKDKLEKSWLFGPVLMKEKSPIFIKKWQNEYNKLRKIIEQMQHATNLDEQKLYTYQRQLQWIKEVLT